MGSGGQPRGGTAVGWAAAPGRTARCAGGARRSCDAARGRVGGLAALGGSRGWWSPTRCDGARTATPGGPRAAPRGARRPCARGAPRTARTQHPRACRYRAGRRGRRCMGAAPERAAGRAEAGRPRRRPGGRRAGAGTKWCGARGCGTCVRRVRPRTRCRAACVAAAGCAAARRSGSDALGPGPPRRGSRGASRDARGAGLASAWSVARSGIRRVAARCRRGGCSGVRAWGGLARASLWRPRGPAAVAADHRLGLAGQRRLAGAAGCGAWWSCPAGGRHLAASRSGTRAPLARPAGRCTASAAPRQSQLVVRGAARRRGRKRCRSQRSMSRALENAAPRAGPTRTRAGPRRVVDRAGRGRARGVGAASLGPQLGSRPL